METAAYGALRSSMNESRKRRTAGLLLRPPVTLTEIVAFSTTTVSVDAFDGVTEARLAARAEATARAAKRCRQRVSDCANNICPHSRDGFPGGRRRFRDFASNTFPHTLHACPEDIAGHFPRA